MKRISERDMIIIGINKTDPCCVYDSNSQMVLAIQEATANAQLSIDRAEHEQIVREIFSTYDEYIEILNQENGSLVGLACAHGWKSNHVEDGIRCRQSIQKLKAKYTTQETVNKDVKTNMLTWEERHPSNYSVEKFYVSKYIVDNSSPDGEIK